MIPSVPTAADWPVTCELDWAATCFEMVAPGAGLVWLRVFPIGRRRNDEVCRGKRNWNESRSLRAPSYLG